MADYVSPTIGEIGDGSDPGFIGIIIGPVALVVVAVGLWALAGVQYATAVNVGAVATVAAAAVAVVEVVTGM